MSHYNLSLWHIYDLPRCGPAATPRPLRAKFGGCEIPHPFLAQVFLLHFLHGQSRFGSWFTQVSVGRSLSR